MRCSLNSYEPEKMMTLFFLPPFFARYKSFLIALLFALTFILSPSHPLLASSAHFCDSVTELPADQCIALTTFYESTNGTSWLNDSNWLITPTPCTDWYGVVCDQNHVTSLSLNNNQLNGELPATLGQLLNLQALQLAGNQLQGGLPAELGVLTQLRVLNLASNQLSGELPAQLGSLTLLIELFLNNNQLSGTLPPQWGQLGQLMTLNVANNHLSGPIPVQLGELVALNRLYLSDNQFSGEIPAQLGSLTLLTELYLNNNQLSGELPAQLGALHQLFRFYAQGNRLTGSIPPELGGLVSLRWLHLDHNQLSGALPPQLASLTLLKQLYLQDNQLSGELPAEWGNLARLEELQLFNNQLSGALPLTYLNLTYLTSLYLYNTDICVPNEATLHNWLAEIKFFGTGWVCGESHGAIAGRVMNEQGVGLPFARVTLYRTTNRWGWWPLGEFTKKGYVGETVADGQGLYYFADLGQEVDYLLQFRAADESLKGEYYEDEGATIEQATFVTVTLGMSRTVDAYLGEPLSPLVELVAENELAVVVMDGASGVTQVILPEGESVALRARFASLCADGVTLPSAVSLTYNNQNYPLVWDGVAYVGEIPAEDGVVSADITLSTRCGTLISNRLIGSVVVYRPMGVITDQQTGQPLAGAKVTLHHVPNWFPKTDVGDNRPNSCQSALSFPPSGMIWNQPAPIAESVTVNPEISEVRPLSSYQRTNTLGQYGWMLPAGCWYVVVEAEGYETTTSFVAGGMPSIFGLDLALRATPSAVFLQESEVNSFSSSHFVGWGAFLLVLLTGVCGRRLRKPLR